MSVVMVLCCDNFNTGMAVGFLGGPWLNPNGKKMFTVKPRPIATQPDTLSMGMSLIDLVTCSRPKLSDDMLYALTLYALCAFRTTSSDSGAEPGFWTRIQPSFLARAKIPASSP